jgi:hypothetical protein
VTCKLLNQIWVTGGAFVALFMVGLDCKEFSSCEAPGHFSRIVSSLASAGIERRHE